MTFFARLTGDRDTGTYFVESRRPLLQVLNGQQLVLGVGKARDPFFFLISYYEYTEMHVLLRGAFVLVLLFYLSAFGVDRRTGFSLTIFVPFATECSQEDGPYIPTFEIIKSFWGSPNSIMLLSSTLVPK